MATRWVKGSFKEFEISQGIKYISIPQGKTRIQQVDKITIIVHKNYKGHKKIPSLNLLLNNNGNAIFMKMRSNLKFKFL